MSERVVAVLGVGVMGGTVLSSVLASGVPAQRVWISEAHQERAADLAQRLGVHVAGSNQEAAQVADVVILAVKPADAAGVLADIAPVVGPGTLVASVVAGLTCAFYETRLPDAVPVVRIMPNTPAVVGAGVSAISAGAAAGDEHLEVIETLLAATGTVVRVPEKLQNAVGATSGSGPAYMFYVIDAMSEAGVRLGLSRDLSTTLAVETMAGAAAMLKQTGEHPAVLRERVSSPGGTTVEALRELDAAGVRAAFLDAVAAADRRTRELAAELS